MVAVIVVGILLAIVVGSYLYAVERIRRPGQVGRCWVHRARLERNTGAHHYWRCDRCGARWVYPPAHRWVGQPVDTEWLETGEWTVMRPPRPNGRPVAMRPPQVIHVVHHRPGKERYDA